MKISELIEALKNHDPNARVVQMSNDGRARLKDITFVEAQAIRLDVFGPGIHDGVLDEEAEMGRPVDEVAIYIGGII